MKIQVFFILFISLFTLSCSSVSPIFSDILRKKNPHGNYEETLDKKDIHRTPEGKAWLAASKKALTEAQTIKLPYSQQGIFHADKPRALGLQFEVKQGERVTIKLDKKENENLVLFADVFKQDGKYESPIVSVDLSGSTFTFDATESGNYVLRIQPPLHHNGDYYLFVSTGPSLLFPVSDDKARTGSFWGDPRDGGKRRHEGIDIFAPKLAPAVAAADGFITGVREDGIGGKVIWLRHANGNLTLYYAHLDKQLVQEGQAVKRGDVIGLVGNTGNAINTSPHLHFGIYTFSGAVDPLPFVKISGKNIPDIPSKKLTTYLQVTKSLKDGNGHIIQLNTLLLPLAISAQGYLAELPDGKIIQISPSQVKLSSQIVKETNVKSQTKGKNI